MSEQVERKILGLIGAGLESPYGNPIPGLDEFGVTASTDFRAGLVTLTEAARARATPTVVTVRRIGEPVQVEPEALTLLTSAGVIPGAQVQVSIVDGRVVVVRAGEDPSTGVSLPSDIAIHVYCEAAAV